MFLSLARPLGAMLLPVAMVFMTLCSVFAGERRVSEPGRLYAVCVGVNFANNAAGQAPLRFSVADAEAFGKVLRENGGYRPGQMEIVTLTDAANGTRPSKKVIVDELNRLAQKAAPNDRLIYFHSGHGKMLNDRSGVVCWSPFPTFRGEEDWLGLEEIGRILVDSRARDKLVIIDACHAGGSKDANEGVRFEGATRDLRHLDDPSLAWLVSCHGFEYSWELPERGLGRFTHFLVDGLDGGIQANQDYDVSHRGGVTLRDLARYVINRIGDYQNENKLPDSHRQTPKLDSSGTAMDMLLVLVVSSPQPPNAAEKPNPLSINNESTSLPPRQTMVNSLAGFLAAGEESFKNKDFRSAAFYYQEAVDVGSAQAELSLGELYCYGLGVDRNYGKALELYQSAAKNDLALAKYYLGSMYCGVPGINIDYAKAHEWYNKARAGDNVEAIYAIGNLYQHGLGVVQSEEKANVFFEEAIKRGLFQIISEKAEAGYPGQQLLLGHLYMKGHGITMNSDKAVEWIRKAVECDYAGAQFYLGIMHYQGEGVVKSTARAIEWIKKAADQDYALAQLQLGYLYYTGDGVSKNNSSAIEWFQKAAAQDLPAANYWLGVMLYNGEGTAKNTLQAIERLRKAYDKGFLGAEEFALMAGFKEAEQFTNRTYFASAADRIKTLNQAFTTLDPFVFNSDVKAFCVSIQKFLSELILAASNKRISENTERAIDQQLTKAMIHFHNSDYNGGIHSLNSIIETRGLFSNAERNALRTLLNDVSAKVRRLEAK